MCKQCKIYKNEQIFNYCPICGKLLQKQGNGIYNAVNEFSDNSNVRNALMMFLEMRQIKKKPVTLHSLNLILKRLNSFNLSDDELVKVINDSTINCWTNVYNNKERKKVQKTKTAVKSKKEPQIMTNDTNYNDIYAVLGDARG